MLSIESFFLTGTPVSLPEDALEDKKRVTFSLHSQREFSNHAVVNSPNPMTCMALLSADLRYYAIGFLGTTLVHIVDCKNKRIVGSVASLTSPISQQVSGLAASTSEVLIHEKLMLVFTNPIVQDVYHSHAIMFDISNSSQPISIAQTSIEPNRFINCGQFLINKNCVVVYRDGSVKFYCFDVDFCKLKEINFFVLIASVGAQSTRRVELGFSEEEVFFQIASSADRSKFVVYNTCFNVFLFFKFNPATNKWETQILDIFQGSGECISEVKFVILNDCEQLAIRCHFKFVFIPLDIIASVRVVKIQKSHIRSIDTFDLLSRMNPLSAYFVHKKEPLTGFAVFANSLFFSDSTEIYEVPQYSSSSEHGTPCHLFRLTEGYANCHFEKYSKLDIYDNSRLLIQCRQQANYRLLELELNELRAFSSPVLERIPFDLKRAFVKRPSVKLDQPLGIGRDTLPRFPLLPPRPVSRSASEAPQLPLPRLRRSAAFGNIDELKRLIEERR